MKKDPSASSALDRAHLEISTRLLLAVLREDLGGWGKRARRRDGRTHLGELSFEESRPTAMGRFELESFPTLRGRPVERVEELLDFLGLEGAEGLRLEAGESARNMALALEAEERRAAGPALAAWRARLEKDPRASSLAFFEQRVFRGHPLHPGARLRRGMTEREQRLWAPEWAPRFALPVIGLEPSEAVDRGGFRDAMAGLFPELDPALAWLPVHPWQLRHELPRLGLERPVRHLESAPMRPSMSLRTLLPDRFGDFPHFKTALAVRLTGAVRIVSVQAAANGPRLTELLSHPRFRSSTLTVLGEPASLHWRRDDPDEAKRVSAVLRQNPEGLSRRGDLLMPAAALIEGSGGGPLVAEIVGSGDPAAWLRDYAGALLRPLLRLMSEEDIALEGHLQNIVVRLRAGETPHFFYRDFGGVRLYPPRLQPRIDGPLDFAPGSATVTNREEELWSKVCYPALQNHLGELIRALTLHFEVPEAELWRPVRELLETHLTRPEERAWFLAPAWRLKAMTRMRIERRVTEYRYGEVRNPLWRG